MSDAEKIQWFKDACGYTVWCLDNHVSAEEMLFNLQHDIIGIARDEECFVPRLNGYSKYWKG